MKPSTIFTLILALLTLSVSAQDLLVKRNGEQQRVKVLEVSKKRVKYVRYRTDAPIYTLPVNDIEYIEYLDGEREYFGKKGSSSPKPTVINIVTHNTVTAEPTAELYSIGSLYEKDGVKGIVIATTEGGAHGTIMSLDEGEEPWSTIERKKLQSCGCQDRLDGRKNMAALEAFISSHSLSWEHFPAAQWCRNKGEGWYLPAITEVWQLGTIVNGGSRTHPRRSVRKQYNELLKACGGKPLNGLMFYHSSTEAQNPKYSTYSHCNAEEPHIGEGAKSDRLFVRAFYRF